MEHTPTISVVVPTYNQRDSLVYAVESILNQTYPVLEVIIVDDGSSDATSTEVELRSKLNGHWRDRVRYIYQANQGQSAANNAGIAIARGEWIGFNASDDLWLPTKLELQIRALERFDSKCGFCFSDAWFMNNPYMKQSVFELAGKSRDQAFGTVANPTRLVALGRHPIWMQTAIARTDMVRQAGGWDQSLRYFEDYDLILRISQLTTFCFVGMPMVLIDRSPTGEPAFGHIRDWHKEEFRLRMEQKCFEKHLRDDAKFPKEIKHILRSNLHNVHKAWANWHLEKGDYIQAKQALSKASTYGFSAMQLAKRAGIRLAPSLLRWAVTRDRKKAIRHDQSSRLASQGANGM
ncbi:MULTISPECIES: glycosyltransferase family A protein [Acidobacteriaceae]|uniref:glycosyltransferase family A protein n=1 Tax=Acidobacteriaceae TaxID=204434 RepID=UPI00131A92C6|nr:MULTISPECIES: glycosyltransferase family A protein [Acidobacteriaceae]MDW5265953.1 glycosyltransferase family A protein [Edaphobacter sp.]